MPSRPQVHLGTSTSPGQSSDNVNKVVNAISRKLTASAQVEQLQPAKSTARRTSFSMDSILHPHLKKDKDKEKKRDERKDQDSEAGRQQKRLASLSIRGGSKSKDRASGPSPRLGPVRPGRIELIVESPPLVMHGTDGTSTGALLGGRLKLHVEDPSGQITLKKMTWILRATIITKKPVGKECRNCAEKHETLKTDMLLTESKDFRAGENNQFPVSFLLPGHLPATTHSQLGSLTYAFIATAITAHDEKIELNHPIEVKRAIPEGPTKASIRIFPPTNLTGRVQLPPVIHPIGTFPVSMTLSGVVEKNTESQTRWRLRKMMWRIEEHSKVVSTPCLKHQSKVSDGKAIQHTETRTLGNDEMKTGWKTDFDTAGGEIALEFEASLATKSNHKPTCDVASTTGLEVKHNLVIELIVAEEFCPNKNTNLITPTGAARVLRMQFNVIVTDRGGMGISWDEEMPPMYEDVPASPPGYGNSDKNDGAFGGAIMEDYNGPELEYTELERLPSGNKSGLPQYRERTDFDVDGELPMRPRHQATVEHDHAGPSSRRPAWTRDELESEPPQYALRTRRDSPEPAIVEDYGEGEAGTAPPERTHRHH